METQLHAFNSEEVAVLLYSLASLQYKPRGALLSAMYRATLAPTIISAPSIAAGLTGSSPQPHLFPHLQRRLQPHLQPGLPLRAAGSGKGSTADINTYRHSKGVGSGGDGASLAIPAAAGAAGHGPGLVALLLWSATRLMPPSRAGQDEGLDHAHAHNGKPGRLGSTSTRPIRLQQQGWQGMPQRGVLQGPSRPPRRAWSGGSAEQAQEEGDARQSLFSNPSSASPSSLQSSTSLQPSSPSPASVWAAQLLSRYWQREPLPQAWQLALILYSLASLRVQCLDPQVGTALLGALAALLRQQQGQEQQRNQGTPVGEQQLQQLAGQEKQGCMQGQGEQQQQGGLVSSVLPPAPQQVTPDSPAGELAVTPAAAPGAPAGFSSRELSAILWALPQLHPGLQLHNMPRHRLLKACLLQLPHFTNAGFAAALWGVARGVREGTPPPGREWVQRAAREAFRRMPYLSPRELPQVLWALAKLRFRPKPPLVLAVRERAPTAASKVAGAGPQQHGLKARKKKPGANARRRAWRRSQGTASVSCPSDWDRLWAHAALVRIQRTALGMDVRGLSAVLHACAWMELLPSKPLLRTLMDLASVRSASMSSRCREGLRSVVSLLVARHARRDARKGLGAQAEGLLRLVCSSSSVAKAHRSAGALFGGAQQPRRQPEPNRGFSLRRVASHPTTETASEVPDVQGGAADELDDLLGLADPGAPTTLPPPLPNKRLGSHPAGRQSRQAWFEIDY